MMKRMILIAVAALVALPAVAQQQEAFPSYVQVYGRAEKEIVPDEFYLSVVLDERDSKGRIAVEQQQKELIATLRRLGVDVEKQLKVANLSSEFFRRGNAVSSARYQLKLGSAAEVAEVWQALGRLGISNVAIQRVSHSRIDRLKDEVRIEAIRNARQNAQTLAGAIGQSVGPCFYIYDSNSDVLPGFYNNAVLTRGMARTEAVEDSAAGEEPLDFKTIRLQYGVQAKFVLE